MAAWATVVEGGQRAIRSGPKPSVWAEIKKKFRRLSVSLYTALPADTESPPAYTPIHRVR